MSNPHVEVGTWWRNLHAGEVRQVADVTSHGIHLLCSECGGDEPFRWSQFTPFWELAPGPKEEPDVEKLLKLERLCREKASLLHDCSPRNASELLVELLKEAGLE